MFKGDNLRLEAICNLKTFETIPKHKAPLSLRQIVEHLKKWVTWNHKAYWGLNVLQEFEDKFFLKLKQLENSSNKERKKEIGLLTSLCNYKKISLCKTIEIYKGIWSIGSIKKRLYKELINPIDWEGSHDLINQTNVISTQWRINQSD